MSFLSFSVEIASKYPCFEAVGICKEAMRDQSFDIKSTNDVNYSIQFSKKQDSILVINSFSPVVKIDFCENDCGTKIMVGFQLRPAVKLILCIYTIVAIIFEVFLINFYLQNALTSSFLLLLPLLLVLFALALSSFGLRVMSMSIKACLVSLLG